MGMGMMESDPNKFVPKSPEELEDALSALGDSGDVTPLREMAVHGHTLYEEFLEAGFTESQALYAAMSLLCGGPKCP